MGRRGDDGLRIHFEAELPRPAIGQRVGVLRRLPSGHPRPRADLEPAQPLDAGVAFPAGEQQTQRKSLFRTQRLAVLRPDHQRVVDRLGDRNRARHHAGVATLGEKPAGVAAQARFREEQLELNAGPFGVAGQAGDFLRRHLRLRFAKRGAAVAGALDKTGSGNLGESPDVVHRESERPLDQPVNEQPVARGIDQRHTGVVALEMQVGRSDGAGELFEWGERAAGDFSNGCPRWGHECRAAAEGRRRCALPFRGVDRHRRRGRGGRHRRNGRPLRAGQCGEPQQHGASDGACRPGEQLAAGEGVTLGIDSPDRVLVRRNARPCPRHHYRLPRRSEGGFGTSAP